MLCYVSSTVSTVLYDKHTTTTTITTIWVKKRIPTIPKQWMTECIVFLIHLRCFENPLQYYSTQLTSSLFYWKPSPPSPTTDYSCMVQYILHSRYVSLLIPLTYMYTPSKYIHTCLPPLFSFFVNTCHAWCMVHFFVGSSFVRSFVCSFVMFISFMSVY